MNDESMSSASHSHGEYTVEQVAGIAAQLLKGNHSNHLKEAAQQALKLMDACQHELSERERVAGIVAKAQTQNREWWDKYVPLENGETYSMPWRAALAHVTGQKVEDRAQRSFKKFYTWYWQASAAADRRMPVEDAPSPTAKQVEDRIAEFKAEGINSRVAGVYKASFPEWKQWDASERGRQNAKKRRKAQPKNPTQKK